MLVVFRVSGLNLLDALVTVECLNAEKREKSPDCLCLEINNCSDRGPATPRFASHDSIEFNTNNVTIGSC